MARPPWIVGGEHSAPARAMSRMTERQRCAAFTNRPREAIRPAGLGAPKMALDAGETRKTFQWDDPLDLTSRLTEEERMVADAARSYAREKLLPRVVSAFREERFDRELMTEMGALGFLGPTLPEAYGGAAVNHVAYGLIAREIEAIDSGYRSAMS